MDLSSIIIAGSTFIGKWILFIWARSSGKLKGLMNLSKCEPSLIVDEINSPNNT